MTWNQNSLKRHMNIPASYLVLMNSDGEVLLLRRFNTGYKDGMYSLPAGHVDAGETFTQALIREAKEETGVDITLDDAFVAHVMHRKSDSDGSERVDVFYVVKNWSGTVENCEPEKCDELRWFAITELPKTVIPYIKIALQNIQDNVQYSEFGW